MKKTPILVSLAVAIVVLASGCSKKNSGAAGGGTASAQQERPVELKLKWETGKKYKWRMDQSMAIDVSLPNQPQPMKQTMVMTQDLAIAVTRDFPEGGQELDLAFEAQQVELGMGERKLLKFDSNQAASRDSLNPMAAMFRRMLDGRLQLVTDGDGRVEKVQGFDAFYSHAAGTNKQMQAMLRQVMSEEMAKRYYSFGESLPNHPVKVGDTWPIHGEMTIPNLFTLVWDLKCTFINWEQHNNRNCIHLSVAGDLASKDAPGSHVKVDKGTLSSENWFDPEAGMMVDRASNMDLQMKINEQKQTIAPRVTQKLNLTLKEIADAK